MAKRRFISVVLAGVLAAPLCAYAKELAGVTMPDTLSVGGAESARRPDPQLLTIRLLRAEVAAESGSGQRGATENVGMRVAAVRLEPRAARGSASAGSRPSA